MNNLKRMQDMELSGKRVLVRFDLNVPFDDQGMVTETTRVDRVKPTVDYLRAQGARVIVMAHLGRPRGQEESLSTRRLIPICEASWGCPIKYVADINGSDARHAAKELQDGDVLILENIRFDAGEEANDTGFAKGLARLGDVYINDGFSVAHRAHASTEGLAHLLPSAAGLSMQAELDALAASVETPKRPVVAVIGGSKVSSKLAVLEHLAARMDALVIGGGMANTFLLAKGVPIGDSLAEADLVDTAKRVLDNAARTNCRIILPTDVVATLSLDAPTDIYHGKPDDMDPKYKIVDIGPESIKAVEEVIASAQTLVWNGPLGVFERPPFDAGTIALARSIAKHRRERGLVAVAGGGDTLAAVEHAGLSDEDFTYLSSAGGAFLEWLEGKELPGVKALLS